MCLIVYIRQIPHPATVRSARNNAKKDQEGRKYNAQDIFESVSYPCYKNNVYEKNLDE